MDGSSWQWRSAHSHRFNHICDQNLRGIETVYVVWFQLVENGTKNKCCVYILVLMHFISLVLSQRYSWCDSLSWEALYWTRCVTAPSTWGQVVLNRCTIILLTLFLFVLCFMGFDSRRYVPLNSAALMHCFASELTPPTPSPPPFCSHWLCAFALASQLAFDWRQIIPALYALQTWCENIESSFTSFSICWQPDPHFHFSFHLSDQEGGSYITRWFVQSLCFCRQTKSRFLSNNVSFVSLIKL